MIQYSSDSGVGERVELKVQKILGKVYFYKCDCRELQISRIALENDSRRQLDSITARRAVVVMTYGRALPRNRFVAGRLVAPLIRVEVTVRTGVGVVISC